ncbi:MAG: alpha/beta hydrolase, partial [Acidimicrobiales bacterium]|nr:alpha/beta hydrolase [Acidimicrobiales bacterium]
PGLVIHSTEDSFSNAAKSREVADMLGARYEELDGLAHFWAVQDPAAGAALLQRFWAEVR